MAARSKFFRSYYLPVLSAEHNDSQSEEIIVMDEEAEIRWKKVTLVSHFVCC